MCSLYSPHVICIVESWLDIDILDSEICIQGYYLCRLDRTRHGGGVLIYVNNMFTHTVLFKGTPDCELLIVSIHKYSNINCSSTSPDFTIALFYRPPNSGFDPLDMLFSALCNIFVSSSPVFYLVGDFNINFLDVPTPLYHELISVVSSFNLTQIVSEPTRVTPTSSTLIDLIFVSSTVKIMACSTVPPLSNADHFGIWFSVESKLSKRSSTELYGGTTKLILTEQQNCWRPLNGTSLILKNAVMLMPAGLLGRTTSCK